MISVHACDHCPVWAVRAQLVSVPAWFLRPDSGCDNDCCCYKTTHTSTNFDNSALRLIRQRPRTLLRLLVQVINLPHILLPLLIPLWVALSVDILHEVEKLPILRWTTPLSPSPTQCVIEVQIPTPTHKWQQQHHLSYQWDPPADRVPANDRRCSTASDTTTRCAKCVRQHTAALDFAVKEDIIAAESTRCWRVNDVRRRTAHTSTAALWGTMPTVLVGGSGAGQPRYNDRTLQMALQRRSTGTLLAERNLIISLELHDRNLIVPRPGKPLETLLREWVVNAALQWKSPPQSCRWWGRRRWRLQRAAYASAGDPFHHAAAAAARRAGRRRRRRTASGSAHPLPPRGRRRGGR